MNKTQAEKFEENREGIDLRIRHMHDDGFPCDRFSFERGYIYALEANGIGEETRIPETVIDIDKHFIVIDWNSRPWASEVRVGYASKDMRPDAIGDRIVTIPRPVPAWEPKDGEAVLVEEKGVGIPGVYQDGMVFCGVTCHLIRKGFVNVKPFPGDDSWKTKTWEQL